MADTLRCPNCSLEIEVSAVLAAQLRDDLRKEWETRTQQREGEIANREQSVRQKEQELEASRRALDQEVADRLAGQRAQVLEEAEARARESVALEVRDLAEQLSESRTKLEEAQSAELELRKERRELENQKRELELAVNRKLDEEGGKIREDAKREAQEEYCLRDADREKLVADLRRQIDDLKRKSEQGSQQAQGEVMEMELEEILRDLFPFDDIEAVATGTHGGDLLQHVRDHTSAECGTILWESKRTKSWSDAWLPKLRDDQRAARAHLAVLATLELPKGLTNFGNIDGVWITNRACLVGLACALRASLVEVAKARRTVEGQQTKIDLLYEYFSGLDFSQRIEGIVEAFSAMRNDLEAERRSIHRIWAKRQKQLDRAIVNTVNLYGDIGSILGAKLPQIPKLELTSIAHDSPTEQLAKAPWD